MKTLDRSLEKLLEHLAEESGQADYLRIHRAWKKAVGPLVAARAFVSKYDRGVVFIGAVDSVWVQELILRKSHWLTQLKRLAGVPVTDILFFPKENPNAPRRTIDSRR
jgi:hypothetical protein